MGPLNLDIFRKNNFSASWRVVELESLNTTSQPTMRSRQGNVKVEQGIDSPAQQARRQLIDKRRGKLAAELVKQDNEILVKLETAAIERSKSVDSAVLGKYSIWRKEMDNENSDSTVQLVWDQMIMSKVYLSIAKLKNNQELYLELQSYTFFHSSSHTFDFSFDGGACDRSNCLCKSYFRYLMLYRYVLSALGRLALGATVAYA